MKFFDQLKSLDPRDVGRWPLPVRGFFIALIFCAVTAFAWYMVVWNDDRPVLLKAEADELDIIVGEKVAQGGKGQIQPLLLDQTADQPDQQHVIAHGEIGFLLKLALVGRALLDEVIGVEVRRD